MRPQNNDSLRGGALPPRPAHGGNLTWAATIAGCSPSLILDFSASINPLGPPASAIAAIQSHLEDLRAYPDPDYHHLRSALGQYHRLPADWILPGNGSAELLTWVCRDLAKLTATYLLKPAFGDYQRALDAFDASVVEFSLSHLSVPELGLRSLLANPDLPVQPETLGLLLNNPHNPSGLLFEVEELLPYLQQFGLVVVDEAFMDFLPPDRQPSLIEQIQHFPNLVILRSLTKFYSLPGLRIGYAIAHPTRLQRWQRWRDPWSVNTLAAAAAIAVLQDTDFQQQTWDWLAATRPALVQGLAALPGLQPYTGSANFLLVKTERSSTQLQYDLLQRHQILIRDCLSFPELGDRYFRVAIRTADENQRLLQGLAEVLGH